MPGSYGRKLNDVRRFQHRIEPNPLISALPPPHLVGNQLVRGNLLIHSLNGHLMSIVVDDDAPKRTREGLIGVQVHVGPPMKVEYRNFRLKSV